MGRRGYRITFLLSYTLDSAPLLAFLPTVRPPPRSLPFWVTAARYDTKGAQRLPGPGHGRVEQRNESKMAFELTIEGAKMRLGLWWLDAAIRGAVDKLPIANLKPEME